MGIRTTVVQSAGRCDKAIRQKTRLVFPWVAGDQGQKGFKDRLILELKLARRTGFLLRRQRGTWHSQYSREKEMRTRH